MNKISRPHMVSLVQYLDTKEEFILLDTSKPSAENHHTLVFVDPITWITCPEGGDQSVFLQEVQEYQDRGYYLSGWFAYEFGYLLEPSVRSLLPPCSGPLAMIGVFEQPHSFDHLSGEFSSDFPHTTEFESHGSSYEINDLAPNISRQEYLRAIEAIKKYILAGDTYQVNYTFKLDFSFSGSPADFYLDLRNNQSVNYGAWLRCGGRDIMSFSPELFFRADERAIIVKPMKGTMKRGSTLEEDARLRKKLADDPKNRSENVMIVDLLRNDLGRLIHELGGGEVQTRSLFDVETYETILQMTSTIEGMLPAKKEDFLPLALETLFPCGSVTGAPKIRTMEIIRELEKAPRGVYCGAIGYSGPEGSVFNVPIRTLSLEQGRGSMGIGSGIVHDSDPSSEWEECLLKGKFLSGPRPDFQLIETMLWSSKEGYWLLDLHLERLADSAAYFLFALDMDRVKDKLAGVEQQLKEDGHPCRIRCLLYQDGEFTLESTRLAQPFRQPVISPAACDVSPLPVTLSASSTDQNDRFLYHKTTNRSFYNRERELAVQQGFGEIFFLNSAGQITEGSISNIFVQQEGRLLTPPVSCGLLNGTLRRFLLEQGVVEEEILTREDVVRADGLYMGNSLRGLIPVRLVV